jgi:hypothetical protein
LLALISDANWHFTEAVADGIKLQRIVLRTSDILLVFAALPLLRERGSFSIKVRACYSQLCYVSVQIIPSQ